MSYRIAFQLAQDFMSSEMDFITYLYYTALQKHMYSVLTATCTWKQIQPIPFQEISVLKSCPVSAHQECRDEIYPKKNISPISNSHDP